MRGGKIKCTAAEQGARRQNQMYGGGAGRAAEKGDVRRSGIYNKVLYIIDILI